MKKQTWILSLKRLQITISSRFLCKHSWISLVKISPVNMQLYYQTKSISPPLNQLTYESACGQGSGNVRYTHFHLGC